MTTIKHHIHNHAYEDVHTHESSRPVIWDSRSRISHTQSVSSRHRITPCHNENTADDNYRY